MTKTRNEERNHSMPLMTWPSFATGPSLQAMQPAVASMAELNGKAILGWMALQREWTGFLMHRIQEEVALAHRLAKCFSPQDMHGVYANFFQQTLTDYQRELGEMMRLGQTSLSEATGATQKTMETDTRDTRRPAA